LIVSQLKNTGNFFCSFVQPNLGYAERMANGQTAHRLADAGHWVAAEEPALFANYWLDFARTITV